VYPVEIEKCIEDHPDVEECAVIGVDDPELGQAVKAVLVPRRGHSSRHRAGARVRGDRARVLQGARALGSARRTRCRVTPRARSSKTSCATRTRPPASSRRTSARAAQPGRARCAGAHCARAPRGAERVVGTPSALPALTRSPRPRSISIGNCARLATAARAANIPVIHCTAETRDDRRGANSNARLFAGVAKSTGEADAGQRWP
jgi:acyl-CoA synthetase (AMP-forming)/AMP-acid ligase II